MMSGVPRRSLSQGIGVVTSDFVRVPWVGEVLAQFREHGTNTLLTQPCRCRERILKPLAGHEPRDRFLDEGQARPMLPQPRALGTGQQYASHQAHISCDASCYGELIPSRITRR